MRVWNRKFLILLSLSLALYLFVFPAFAQEGESTETPPIDVPPVEETAVEETLDPVFDDATKLLMDARFDLELLAALTQSGGRPGGWSGLMDPNNPDMAILLRLDLELLAGTLLGADTRPPGWFGVVASSPYFIARDVRHDLELLAETSGQARPSDWAGAEPLLSCDRATQALIRFMVEVNQAFTLQADRTAPDFCTRAMLEASLFVEVNYLSNPTGATADTLSAPAGSIATNSRFAVLFVDRNASARLGVIPEGTVIQPIARSYAQYSAMMFIRGEGFAGFVDYQFTNLDERSFRDLPNIDDIETESFCSAEWCDLVG